MKADPAHALVEAVTRALNESPTDKARPRVAVAYSGGVDSTALLHAVSTLHHAGAVEAFAFHVHHGLSAHADQWLEHCRTQAAALGVVFDAERVTLSTPHASIEAEARTLRYAALGRLCVRHDCRILMTAHHLDDQAETVLVNLGRGAGIGGLAGAARSRPLDGLTLLRPLIDLPADRLRAHVETHALAHVEDPSNADRRFTRNAIRHEVMPALRRIVPSIAERLARTASHASAMQGLLDDIGLEDLRAGTTDASSGDLDVDTLATLSEARAANALRVWLVRRGMRAPSAAALREMLDQFLHSSPNAQIELLHERRALRLYRGRVSIDAGKRPRAGFVELAWSGEDVVDVPPWNGRLRFEPATSGFDAAQLRAGVLTLRERRGGERLRLHRGGPSRTLKNLYQEAGVPAWKRARLPLLYLDDRLIYAAGIGPDASMTLETASGASPIGIDWQPHGDGAM